MPDKFYAYNGKLISPSAGKVIGFSAPTYETYFDFRSTYTLSSATASSIDLTHTSLSRGTKPYVVFYMDITCTADTETGNDADGVTISGNAAICSIGLGKKGSFAFNTHNGLYEKGYSSVTARQITSTATPYNALKLIVRGANNDMIAQIRYRNGSTGVWSQYGSTVTMAMGLENPHTLNGIASPGGRQGKFTATNFKACGFDTVAEAEAWMES